MIAHGQIPEKLLAVAFRELHNYTVSFIQDREQRGSGILVEIDGVRGILTAGHVAGPLFKNIGCPIGIAISDKSHRFEIQQEALEKITIPPEGKDINGFDIPDISFIKFLAPTDIATINAKKSFYPFRKPTNVDLNSPSALTALYAAGGSPLTRGTKTGTPNTESILLCAQHFFTAAQFNAVERIGDFDYLSLGLVANVDRYPTSYNGVSGGGMWHIPLHMNPDKGLESINYLAPELIGVIYCQSELLSQSRVIRGHTLSLIFDRLRNEIKQYTMA